MLQKQKVSGSQGNEKQWHVWVEPKVCGRALTDVPAGDGPRRPS